MTAIRISPDHIWEFYIENRTSMADRYVEIAANDDLGLSICIKEEGYIPTLLVEFGSEVDMEVSCMSKSELEDQYSATDLGGMFGVGAPTVSRYCKEALPGIVFRRGSRMTKENRAAFAEFCGKEDCPDNKAPVVKTPGVRRAVSSVGAVAPTNASGMAMNRFSLHFSGRFDANMVVNSLSYMLPDGADADIEIVCNIKNT